MGAESITVFEVFINGPDFFFEKPGNQDVGYQITSHEGAEGELKIEIVVSEAFLRSTDEGHGADFCGQNGEAGEPPGHAAPGQKIILRVFFPASGINSKTGCDEEIADNDGIIQTVEMGGHERRKTETSEKRLGNNFARKLEVFPPEMQV